MKRKISLIIIGILLLIGILFLMQGQVQAADSEGNFVIVLDPGHGGTDPGAIAGGIREDTVNFKLAYYAKQELEQYEGVKVYLTRYNDCPTIYDRVEIAKNYNADLLVSMHINSGGGGSANGAAVWVTQDNTKIQYYQKAAEAANKILANISYIGIKNNGVQTRSGQPNEWYNSGVVQDYYGIIRYAQRVEMRSLLVEHCFIDNASDRSHISSDDAIKRLAQADVNGIVEAYALQKKNTGSVPVKTLSLNINELNMEITSTDSQPVYYFTPIFTPTNATNQGIEWYSTDANTVRVYEGKIRALREGEATITAISKNNQRLATCKVVVTKPAIPLQNISIEKTEQTLSINEKTHLNVSFYPNNCSDQTLYWTSSNPDVVRVWDGDIRGLKEGVSIITATSRAGAKQVSCKVIVKDDNKVYVEQIIPEKEEYTIGINEAITINYDYMPKNAENIDFSWTSSNPDVLRVYWNQIRGLKEGTAEIIIKTPEGITEKRITVHVKNIKVEQIIPEQEEYTIEPNEVININYSYLPENASNTDFSWTASDSSILSVYWNKVRGLKPGIAYVIIRTPDGSIEKRIKITVKSPYEIKVKPEQETYTIGINEAIDINCTYTPSNLTAEDFTWTASNPEILSVYWDRIRGLKAGTTELIIKSLDGTYEKKIKIIVKGNSDINTEVKPEQETYTIGINEAININCTYTPSNLTAEDFRWTASNPEILSVYWDRIRGLKAGTTELIIKSLDGAYEKKIKIIVKGNSGINTEVNPEQETYTIGINEAIDINCTYTPSNLTAEDFTWTASDPEILSVYWDRIRGLKAGTTELIIKSLDGNYENRIKVVVKGE